MQPAVSTTESVGVAAAPLPHAHSPLPSPPWAALENSLQILEDGYQFVFEFIFSLTIQNMKNNMYFFPPPLIKCSETFFRYELINFSHSSATQGVGKEDRSLTDSVGSGRGLWSKLSSCGCCCFDHDFQGYGNKCRAPKPHLCAIHQIAACQSIRWCKSDGWSCSFADFPLFQGLLLYINSWCIRTLWMPPCETYMLSSRNMLPLCSRVAEMCTWKQHNCILLFKNSKLHSSKTTIVEFNLENILSAMS